MSMDAAGEARESHETEDRSGRKAGPEGTVPVTEKGVGLGAGNEPNTFEPEEDPTATAESTEKVEGTAVDTSEPS